MAPVAPGGSAGPLSALSLTLLFTRRTGLGDWDRIGSMERELAIYQRLAGLLRQVNLVTYGGRRDRHYAEAVRPLHLCPLPRHLPTSLSRSLLLHMHAGEIAGTDIVKTNQVAGAEVGRWLKRRHGKALIVRCGYLYSRFMVSHTPSRYRVRRAFHEEHAAFTEADVVAVTSNRDRDWAIEHHGLGPQKIRVIPNYVDTDIFRPDPGQRRRYDLCCLARSGPQKNVESLLEAMASLARGGRKVSGLLIGSAAEDRGVRERARTLGVDLSWLTRVRNVELPELFASCTAFVLPSLYEGHPKALLEAMSCGLPCIGTDVVGIREDLQHLENGYLCDTSPAAIADAIDVVLADADLRRELGGNARRYVQSNYDLDTVLDLEIEMIRDLQQRHRG